MNIKKSLLLSSTLTAINCYSVDVLPNFNPLSEDLERQVLEEPGQQKVEQSTLQAIKASEQFAAIRKMAGTKMPEITKYVIDSVDNSNLIVTEESLNRLRENLKHPNLKINLCDEANAATLVYHALGNVLNAPVDNQYLHGLNTQLDKATKKLMGEICKELRDNILNEQQNFENKVYSANYLEILKKLSRFKKLLQESYKKQKMTDSDFIAFVEAAQKVMKLVVVRYNTQKALQDDRIKLLGFQANMYTSSVATTITIPIPTTGIPIPNLTPSVNFSVSKSTTAVGTQTSMYTIAKATSVKGGATISIAPISVSGKVGLDVIESAVIYSLEAYMDYLIEGKTIKDLGDLQARLVGMGDHLKARNELKKLEKDVISKTELFQFMLKCLGEVLPQYGAELVWISKTESHGAIKTQEIAGGVELGANLNAVAAKLGCNLKGQLSVKRYMKEMPIMNLINEDCSPANGCDLNDLISAIGKEYSLDEQKNMDPTYFLGYLRDYVFAISTPNNKYAQAKKHDLEKNVFKCKNGRNHVLRSAIITAAKLKCENLNQDNKDIFLRIYTELTKLAEMCVFSKNNSGIRSLLGYGTKSTNFQQAIAKTATLLGQFSVNIPMLNQNIVVDAKLSSIAGSPVLEENGKFLTLTFTLPFASTGIVGLNILRHWFGGVFSQVKGLDSNDLLDLESVMKAFSMGAVGSVASGVLSTLGSPVSVSLVGSSQFMFIWKYHDSRKDYTNIRNVPGLELAKKEAGSWVFDWMAIISYLTGSAALKSNLVDLPLTLQGSLSYDKLAKRTGVNTYHDIRAKFNILSLGKSDNAYDTEIIDGGLTSQSGQIFKIFKNTLRSGSNSAFELQMMYNALLATCNGNKAEENKITELFTKFVVALKNIFGQEKASNEEDKNIDSEEFDEITTEVARPEDKVEQKEAKGRRLTANTVDKEKFKIALDLLKQIMTVQFKKLFLPYWNKSFDKRSDNKAQNVSENTIKGVSSVDEIMKEAENIGDRYEEEEKIGIENGNMPRISV